MTPNYFKTDRDVRRRQLRSKRAAAFRTEIHECEADGDWQEREQRIQAKIAELQPLLATATTTGARR